MRDSGPDILLFPSFSYMRDAYKPENPEVLKS